MIIVSDTTPIISLLKIDKLSLLQDLFGEVRVPNAVYNELTTNSRFESEAKKIRECPFIKIVNVSNLEIVNELLTLSGLDLGESEAIAYAEESKATLLLIDESKGRFVARNRGLSITGTVGIILDAYHSRFITKTDILSYVDTLKNNKRFISESLYQRILQEIR